MTMMLYYLLLFLWVRSWGGTCRQAQSAQELTPQNSLQPRVMGVEPQVSASGLRAPSTLCAGFSPFPV